MPKVDFYNLPTSEMADCLLFCCKLINKVWQQVEGIHVLCQNIEQRQQFDELLWHFKPNSFIAHDLIEESPKSPISLSYEGLDNAVTNTALLINLSANVPTNYNQFSRIAEFVIDDPILKNKARDTYRFYKMQDCPVDYHNLTKI